MPPAKPTRAIRLRQFCFALFSAALIFRVAIAVGFQTRSWIDELWVMMNPAYRLLTGIGHLNFHDWGGPPKGVRTWTAPTLFYFLLQALDWLGIRRGDTVQAIVRALIAVASTVSIAAFIRLVQQRFALKSPPWIALLIALWTPMFVHYGGMLDLSVLAFPIFVAALWLFERSRWRHAHLAGSVLFALSIIVRFQFIIFAGLYALYLLFRTREYDKLKRFLAVNTAALVIDTAYNFYMFGRPVLPIFNYFWGNAFWGYGDDAGTMPMGAGLEFLWRWTTEPVFFLIFATLVFSFKRAFFATLCGAVYLFIHIVLSHKEFRYFYAPALMLTAIAGVALQAWVEENKRSQRARLAAASFVAAFLVFAFWRGTMKTPWNEFEIPAKLETAAGVQNDVKGLLVYGWGGIYCGGQYAFYQPLPYVCEERRANFKGLKLKSRDYNYVVTGLAERAPCIERVREEGGGVLYRCTENEIAALVH